MRRRALREFFLGVLFGIALTYLLADALVKWSNLKADVYLVSARMAYDELGKCRAQPKAPKWYRP